MLIYYHNKHFIVFVKAFKSLAIGVTTLTLSGCALGIGFIFASLLRSEAYAPEMGGALFTRAMLGSALVESFLLFVVIFVLFIYIM